MFVCHRFVSLCACEAEGPQMAPRCLTAGGTPLAVGQCPPWLSSLLHTISSAGGVAFCNNASSLFSLSSFASFLLYREVNLEVASQLHFSSFLPFPLRTTAPGWASLHCPSHSSKRALNSLLVRRYCSYKTRVAHF